MSTDRRNNFKRIAEARTNKIIHYIDLLGNLSNKSYYDYTQKEIISIFNAIRKELDDQQSRFEDIETTEKKFRL